MMVRDVFYDKYLHSWNDVGTIVVIYYYYYYYIGIRAKCTFNIIISTKSILIKKPSHYNIYYYFTCSAGLPSWISEMNMPVPSSACFPSIIIMPKPWGLWNQNSKYFDVILWLW